MAIFRDLPYAQFNFLVNLGTGQTEGPEAGFQECSALSMTVDVIEYRNGNDRENTPRKLTGLASVSNVTLKRGIIGSLSLYQWIDQIRNGDQAAQRTVTIQLQNEDHTAIVMTWKLLRARIIKHTTGPLNAKGTDVAMEELTLAYERLELE
ncbi:MAG TPA: phage tail protein [Vicinamibacterales bacterium]|nr:phage tail protein [Vicinamibacterales bacterium]